MSERLGALALFTPNDGVGSGWSEATAAEVDAEARVILAETRQQASAILTSNRGVLHDLTATLVEVESLEGEALEEFLRRVSGPDQPVVALVAS